MALTLLILLLYAITILYKSNYMSHGDDHYFFEPLYTKTLKGLCTVIIVFVHIPLEYTNRIQDAAGSFAYICVTLFFLFSGYGIQWCFKNKKGYLNNFFRNRILIILIPFLISCLVKLSFGFGLYSGGSKFVYIIILFYITTYFAHKYCSQHAEVIICIIVLSYSLVGAFTGGVPWYVESIGFAYGVLLVKHIDKIKGLLSKRYFMIIIITTVASFTFGIMYLKYKNLFFLGDYMLRAILGISIVLWVLCCTYRIKIGNNIAYFLGNQSYEMFLTHGFVINILQYLDQDLNVLKLSSGSFIFMTFTISILLSYLFSLISKYFAKKVKVST